MKYILAMNGEGQQEHRRNFLPDDHLRTSGQLPPGKRGQQGKNKTGSRLPEFPEGILSAPATQGGQLAANQDTGANLFLNTTNIWVPDS